MFSDVIVVPNIKETFIPWLNDRHINKSGNPVQKKSHMYLSCDSYTYYPIHMKQSLKMMFLI